MRKNHRKFVIRLYAEHDMDLILLSHSAVANFSKVAKLSVLAYLRNLPMDNPWANGLSEIVSLPESIKMRQFTVYFDEDEDADVINYLNTLNSINGFIKYVLRRYLLTNFQPATDPIKKAFVIPIGKRDSVVPLQRNSKKKKTAQSVTSTPPISSRGYWPEYAFSESKAPDANIEQALPDTQHNIPTDINHSYSTPEQLSSISALNNFNTEENGNKKTTANITAHDGDEDEFIPSKNETEEAGAALFAAINSLGGFK